MHACTSNEDILVASETRHWVLLWWGEGACLADDVHAAGLPVLHAAAVAAPRGEAARHRRRPVATAAALEPPLYRLQARVLVSHSRCAAGHTPDSPTLHPSVSERECVRHFGRHFLSGSLGSTQPIAWHARRVCAVMHDILLCALQHRCYASGFWSCSGGAPDSAENNVPPGLSHLAQAAERTSLGMAGERLFT